MRFHAIDTLWIVADDPFTVAATHARLGLSVASIRRPSGVVWTWSAGGIRVEIVPVDPPTQPVTVLAEDRRGLTAVGVRADDLTAALNAPNSGGPGGLVLPLQQQAGVNLLLTDGEPPPDEPAANSFPLKRLDHLAVVAPDLDATTRFWIDRLGVPVHGEVTTPTMVIRQFRIGDAIVELLGPASADSPLHQRPSGLISMTSWEVPDLEAAVALARAAGFQPGEPAVGVLPGTRTATIPASEFGGLALQLLEYV